jgi:hypothetical protein
MLLHFTTHSPFTWLGSSPAPGRIFSQKSSVYLPMTAINISWLFGNRNQIAAAEANGAAKRNRRWRWPAERFMLIDSCELVWLLTSRAFA